MASTCTAPPCHTHILKHTKHAVILLKWAHIIKHKLPLCWLPWKCPANALMQFFKMCPFHFYINGSNVSKSWLSKAILTHVPSTILQFELYMFQIWFHLSTKYFASRAVRPPGALQTSSNFGLESCSFLLGVLPWHPFLFRSPCRFVNREVGMCKRFSWHSRTFFHSIEDNSQYTCSHLSRATTPRESNKSAHFSPFRACFSMEQWMT